MRAEGRNLALVPEVWVAVAGRAEQAPEVVVQGLMVPALAQ